MYGDVYRVAVLVHDLYHLLVAVALRHFHQSAKLPYSMIDMHHVVTHLKLLYLLQCQCHLSAPSLVRPQVILVETVEHLMVRKKT